MPTEIMQNQIFQSFVKFMHGKKHQKTTANLGHLCIQLEIFALILKSKIVFKNLFFG